MDFSWYQQGHLDLDNRGPKTFQGGPLTLPTYRIPVFTGCWYLYNSYSDTKDVPDFANPFTDNHELSLTFYNYGGIDADQPWVVQRDTSSFTLDQLYSYYYGHARARYQEVNPGQILPTIPWEYEGTILKLMVKFTDLIHANHTTLFNSINNFYSSLQLPYAQYRNNANIYLGRDAYPPDGTLYYEQHALAGRDCNGVITGQVPMRGVSQVGNPWDEYTPEIIEKHSRVFSTVIESDIVVEGGCVV